MINRLLTHGRFLFIRDGCDACKKWKQFIYFLNAELKLNKRIRVIDCTNYHDYGIIDNPIIKLFDEYIDDYPTLIIEGERKVGTNSLIECKAWLKTRLFNDFIFPQEPEYLEELDRYMMFNQKCRFKKGRIICERLD